MHGENKNKFLQQMVIDYVENLFLKLEINKSMIIAMLIMMMTIIIYALNNNSCFLFLVSQNLDAHHKRSIK